MILKDYLKDCVKTKKIPGIAVAYVTSDSNYFLNVGFKGYKNYLGDKYPVNDKTLYDLASLTKVVSTTTLILKLIEDGYFDLDTPVQKIIPEFKYSNVTIKHLLTHTSGLPADNKDYKKCINALQMWEFTLNEPQIYEPGTKVEYSDFGYIILGKVIEHYKASLEEYAREVIFKPLGMFDTMYNPHLKNRIEDCAASEFTDARGLIRGIVHDGKAFKLNGLSGNAGLFSTTKDLVKFVRMILDEGYPVLKKDTVEMFKKCQTPNLNLSRTIGWFFSDKTTAVADVCSDCSLWHTGFAGGSIYIDFVRNCAIIVLTNRVHPSRDNDITEIRKTIHGLILNGNI